MLVEGMEEGENERVEVDVCEDYKNDTYDKDQSIMAYMYRIRLFHVERFLLLNCSLKDPVGD